MQDVALFALNYFFTAFFQTSGSTMLIRQNVWMIPTKYEDDYSPRYHASICGTTPEEKKRGNMLRMKSRGNQDDCFGSICQLLTAM